MISRPEKMTEKFGEYSPKELERRQRASAPTLRDLLVPREAVPANAIANRAPHGQAHQSSRLEKP